MPGLAPWVDQVTGVCATPAGQALEMSMSSPAFAGVNVVVTPVVWFQPWFMAAVLKSAGTKGRNLPLLLPEEATRTAASAAFLVSD